MECQHATELIISAADGDLVDAALLTEARLHCATCPDCLRVERLLQREAALSAPKAPASLVARLETLGADIAREHRESASPPVAELPSDVLPAGQQHLPRRRWVGAVALVSTAAVLFLAMSVSTLVLNSRGGQQEKAEETAFDLRTQDSAASAPESAAGDVPAPTAELQAAPAYVVFEGLVYVQSAEAVPSVLTTAGTVVSDLGTGSSGDHTVMSAPGTVDPVFVQTEAGTYLSFSRVVRTFARSPYALASETPIATFGQWPGLPAAYLAPENADGSPTFSKRGFDDHGQSVFAPATRVLDDAFAIAPGTPEDDPASGNPNWTWWVEVE